MTSDQGEKPLELQLLDGTVPETPQKAPVPPAEEPVCLAEPRNVPPPPKRIVLPEPAAPAAPPQALAEAGTLVGTGVSLGIALLASFLPQPWRQRLGVDGLPWRLAGLVGGFVQMVVVLFVGAILFERYRDGLLREFLAVAGDVPLDNGTLMGFGAAVYLGFLISPTGLVCTYFFTEGVVRAVSAGIVEEALGTLPLWLAMKVHSFLAARRAERRLGPLCIDEVTRGEHGELRIATCRTRAWDALTTLAFAGGVYRVVKHEELASGPRRHVYSLTAAPQGHVIRRLTAYAPDDLVKQKARGAPR